VGFLTFRPNNGTLFDLKYEMRSLLVGWVSKVVSIKCANIGKQWSCQNLLILLI